MSMAEFPLRPALKALRPHQWAKNLLVFVPLIASHRLSAPGAITASLILDALIVFVSFSLCASSAYVINDLCDLEADRQHPTKRHRPFASGALSPGFGGSLATACGVLGIGLSLLFPGRFYLFIVAYIATTLLYSLRLKQVAVLDIVLLASLYTVRILGAGSALQISISPWLIAFSMFLFFSLATVKRFAELRESRERGRAKLPGRGYVDADLEVVSQWGVASGYIAALVLVLYANDPAVTRLYRSPQLLWCAGLVLVYWLSRLFLLAHRGELDVDPLVFALKDRVSYCLGAALGGLFLAAMLTW